MKCKVFTVTGLIGSAIADLFGGWDSAFETLLLFMILDWVTGGILLPGVFGKSPKSENGSLESRAGFKGLCRKGMMLLYVLIAYRLDLTLHTDYIRNIVCIGFIANELLSVVENAGIMGMPLPEGRRQGIDILKNSSNSTETLEMEKWNWFNICMRKLK